MAAPAAADSGEKFVIIKAFGRSFFRRKRSLLRVPVIFLFLSLNGVVVLPTCQTQLARYNPSSRREANRGVPPPPSLSQGSRSCAFRTWDPLRTFLSSHRREKWRRRKRYDWAYSWPVIPSNKHAHHRITYQKGSAQLFCYVLERERERDVQHDDDERLCGVSVPPGLSSNVERGPTRLISRPAKETFLLNRRIICCCSQPRRSSDSMKVLFRFTDSVIHSNGSVLFLLSLNSRHSPSNVNLFCFSEGGHFRSPAPFSYVHQILIGHI